MRRVALTYYALTIGLAGAAWLAWKMGPAPLAILAPISSLGITYVAYRLGVLDGEERTAVPGAFAAANGVKLGRVQKLTG